MASDNLKEFIKDYREEINNKKFEEVYSYAHDELHDKDIGKLTDLFYKFGVDPLKHMNEVPYDYALESSIKSIVIPSNIKSIGIAAFAHCKSLTSVNITDSVTSIGWGAFKGCTSLTSVTIPNSVKSIVDYAFYDCTSLKSINYTGSKNQWSTINMNSRWTNGSLLKTIHCIDGDIDL